MNSKLYEELRDLAMEDATIYAFLKTQEATGVSDLHTATMLIRQLAKEKKTYFDQAVTLSEYSTKPKGYVGQLFGVEIVAKPWWRRLDFWNYRKVSKGVWVKK